MYGELAYKLARDGAATYDLMPAAQRQTLRLTAEHQLQQHVREFVVGNSVIFELDAEWGGF